MQFWIRGFLVGHFRNIAASRNFLNFLPFHPHDSCWSNPVASIFRICSYGDKEDWILWDFFLFFFWVLWGWFSWAYIQGNGQQCTFQQSHSDEIKHSSFFFFPPLLASPFSRPLKCGVYACNLAHLVVHFLLFLVSFKS